MRHTTVLSMGLALLSFSGRASASDAPDAPAAPVASPSHDDLFPGAGHVMAAAASGAPFLGIAEIGVGFTNGFALGAIGGVALAYAPTGTTPSVPTAGIRPRLRIPTSERTALVVIAPMLYYPSATPGSNVVSGGSSWLVARPELYFDGAIGEHWHVAGGMGFIAAASTQALGDLAGGRQVVMPPYNTTTESTKGFAGGIWNTISRRARYALAPRTHLFAEGTLVMMGVLSADLGGPPPVVVEVGAQHAF
jgi:hypothetical protein